jgi:hypothetical protein
MNKFDIPQTCVEYAELLNRYEKEGLKKKLASQFKTLDYLDIIVRGFNDIIH